MAFDRTAFVKNINDKDYVFPLADLRAGIEWYNTRITGVDGLIEKQKGLTSELANFSNSLNHLEITPESKATFSSTLTIIQDETKNLIIPPTITYTDTELADADDSKRKIISNKLQAQWTNGQATLVKLNTLNSDLVELRDKAIKSQETQLEENRKAIIAEYKAALDTATNQLNTTNNLTSQLANDDKGIKDDAGVQLIIPSFSDNEAKLAARKKALEDLNRAKIEDLSESEEKLKFDSLETPPNSTKELIAKLVENQNALQAAISAAKDARAAAIEKLKQKFEEAEKLPPNYLPAPPLPSPGAAPASNTHDQTLNHRDVKAAIDRVTTKSKELTELKKKFIEGEDFTAPEVNDKTAAKINSALSTQAESVIGELITLRNAALAKYNEVFPTIATLDESEGKRLEFVADATKDIALAEGILNDIINPPANTATMTGLATELTNKKQALADYLATLINTKIDDADKKDAFFSRDQIKKRANLNRELQEAIRKVRSELVTQYSTTLDAALNSMQPAFDAYTASGKNYHNHPAVQNKILPELTTASDNANTALATAFNALKNHPLPPPPINNTALKTLQTFITTQDITTKMNALTSAVNVVDTNLAAYQLEWDITGLINEITDGRDPAIWNKVDKTVKDPVDVCETELRDRLKEITFDPVTHQSKLTIDELNLLRGKVDSAVRGFDTKLSAAKNDYRLHAAENEAARQKTIAEIDALNQKVSTDIQSFLNPLDPTIRTKILGTPGDRIKTAFRMAAEAYDAVVTTPLIRNTSTVLDPTSYPDKRINPWRMMAPSFTLDTLIAEKKKVENASNALGQSLVMAKAEAAKIKELADNAARVTTLIDKINTAASDALAKHRSTYPLMSAYLNPPHPAVADAALVAKDQACINANKKLLQLKTGLLDGTGNQINPPTIATVDLTKREQDVDLAITALNDAIDLVAVDYQRVNKPLKDKKIQLKADITKLLIDNDKIRTRVALDPAFTTKHPNVMTQHTNLTTILGDVDKADPTTFDALKNSFDTLATLYPKSILNAQVDIEKFRPENAEKQFKKYVKRIDTWEAQGHITNTVDSTVLAEMERVKDDLALYQAWVMKKTNSTANEQQKAHNEFVRLNNIIKNLKAGAPAIDGALHFGDLSIKVDDTSDPKNITNAKEELRKHAPYAAAASTTGWISTGKPVTLVELQKAVTKGFYGFDAQNKPLEGRVTLHKSNDEKTISFSTQFVKDGTFVTEKEFLTDKKTGQPLYDNSTQSGFHFYKFSSDSANEDAINTVLQHIFASQPDAIRQKMVNANYIDIINGNVDPILRQLAKDDTIYINGDLPDTYAQAVMDICKLIGAPCEDTRNGPNCNRIKDDVMTKERLESYRILLHDNKDILLKNKIPLAFVARKEYHKDLAKSTTPPTPKKVK